MTSIIIDLDGTLADAGHRLHYVQTPGRKDWKKFFEEMHLDRLNVWCKKLMDAMRAAGCRIIIVSGRPDSYRTLIEAWLKQNTITYDEMHLRKEGDRRPDTIVKREILYDRLTKKDILFVVDDRQSVVQMWRSEGLICLQCNPEPGLE